MFISQIHIDLDCLNTTHYISHLSAGENAARFLEDSFMRTNPYIVVLQWYNVLNISEDIVRIRRSKASSITFKFHLKSAQTCRLTTTHRLPHRQACVLPFSENSQSSMAWSQSEPVSTVSDDPMTSRRRCWLDITMCLMKKLTIRTSGIVHCRDATSLKNDHTF